MAKFSIFGIPVTVGFDNDLVEKYERYNQLNEETWDDSKPVKDWDEWNRKMSEQVDLYYELREEGVFGSDEEEKPSGGNWFSRWFG